MKSNNATSNQFILAIETSCDDTAVALFNQDKGVLWNKVVSQDAHHAPYGGVVPEIASRDHVARLITLVAMAAKEMGGLRPSAVACTAGPGLPGCLAAGVAVAQALARAWDVRLAPVNHLEGHLLSPFLDQKEGFGFPYLAVLVSGGHTALVEIQGTKDYTVLGETLDDAVGEAFDKTGTLLGLPFPGGAGLERLAAKGDGSLCKLPVAMRKRKDLAMSFSGLKTAARIKLAEGHDARSLAAAFQDTVVETVAAKVQLALARTKLKRVVVVGGVGRNAAMRDAIARVAGKMGAKSYTVSMKWCTDNAAMIALAGLHRMQEGYSVQIKPRWPLSELN